MTRPSDPQSPEDHSWRGARPAGRWLRSAAGRLLSADRLAAVAAAAGDPEPLLELTSAESAGPADNPHRRTPWAHGTAAPIRAFLGAETGGAALLIIAILVALLWSNVPWRSSYATVWSSILSIHLVGHTLTMDLRDAVNDGLMTLFFLVVGLESKRELDLGELRDRRRLTVPVLAGVGGMTASIVIYLAITAGGTGASGWGVAASTDTALALGTLTLATGDRGARLRVFLLTVLVVDDLAALFIITFVYPGAINTAALATAIGLFCLLMSFRWLGLRVRDNDSVSAILFAGSVAVGVILWLALFIAGIDPVICGLIIGLLTSAYTPRPVDLEHGAELAANFRAEPTPEAAYSARAGLTAAISPNERLQYRLHPWTSRVIVPLFALANAGVHLNDQLLRAAISSPVTWGIVFAFVIGKPVGILATAWITAREAPRAGKLPVSWADLTGTASSAGVAFTASLLVASRAFHGLLLGETKIGVLATVLIAPPLTAAAFRPLRDRPTVDEHEGDAPATDLVVDLDLSRDHVRGRPEAPVTIVAYVSYGCEPCVRAAAILRSLQEGSSETLRYAIRHLPLTEVAANAEFGAEILEAAAAQEAFWPMFDALFEQGNPATLVGAYRAGVRLGLDLDRFFTALSDHLGRARIAADVRSADASGVTGTPAIFLDGHRWSAPITVEALRATVEGRARRASPVEGHTSGVSGARG